MLKKRIIGVVVVKNGWAVQSFEFGRYLPLGRPEWLVENLDRWGADEIAVLCIDRTASNLGPDFDLLDRLAKLRLETPLIYGGGIRTVEDGAAVVRLAADRIVIDSLLRSNVEVAYQLTRTLGAQAVIGSLPVSVGDGELRWFDYHQRISTPLKSDLFNAITNELVSELLLIDWRNEGYRNRFANSIVAKVEDVCGVPLILFGGISENEQIQTLLSMPLVSAVAIGNFLNYREHSIQEYRLNAAKDGLRRPSYKNAYI